LTNLLFHHCRALKTSKKSEIFPWFRFLFSEGYTSGKLSTGTKPIRGMEGRRDDQKISRRPAFDSLADGALDPINSQPYSYPVFWMMEKYHAHR
jgi:hypothetical protein